MIFRSNIIVRQEKVVMILYHSGITFSLHKSQINVTYNV